MKLLQSCCLTVERFDFRLPDLVFCRSHRYNLQHHRGSCLLFHGVFDDDAERHFAESA